MISFHFSLFSVLGNCRRRKNLSPQSCGWCNLLNVNLLTVFNSLQPVDSVKIRIETCHNGNPTLTKRPTHSNDSSLIASVLIKDRFCVE